tara:strand:- start:1351 stop:1629 length:279 start_codon:yes stop_codon:yes gene_type:complete
MENTPEKNLISDVCDAISSGKTFGGWTDLTDSYGFYSKNQIRTKGRQDRKKFNLLNKQRSSREKFKVDTATKMARAKVKDIRQDPRDSIRQR